MFREMKRMQREFDRAFNNPFWTRGLVPVKKASKDLDVRPDTDVQETEKEFIMQFDLPGVDKEDIKLNVDEKSISVKAEKKFEKNEETDCYLHQERSSQSYFRSFSLPKKIVPENVDADYKNGVLTVKMPKKEIEHQEKKQIEVKVN